MTDEQTTTPPVEEKVEGPLEVQLKPKKPRKPRAVAPPVERTAEQKAQIEAIKQMTSKKHIKIWLLHAELLSNKEVAEILGTNSGHVGNAIRDYNAKPELIEAAKAMKPAITIDTPAAG